MKQRRRVISRDHRNQQERRDNEMVNVHRRETRIKMEEGHKMLPRQESGKRRYIIECLFNRDSSSLTEEDEEPTSLLFH